MTTMHPDTQAAAWAELSRAKRTIASLVETCKMAHAQCLHSGSILAKQLEREIRRVEPEWEPKR